MAGRHSPVALRVGLGCVVITGVCLAQLSASDSGADSSFVPGTASASAQAIELAPTTGSLSYAVTLATSVAAYQITEGQALSQTLDLGAIGTSLTSDSCTGGPPTVNPSQLPQPIEAESTNGNQSLTGTEADQLSPAGAAIGDESADATTQPAGSSTTTIASDNLAGLVSVDGATSSANAALQNGATRYASATADISTVSLDNGLVTLGGLHWVATQTSGASTTATGSFDVSTLSIAGTSVPVSNDSVATILEIINTALSPVGFQIDWPQQQTQSDGTVTITPLTIGIDNNTLGQEIIGANEGQIEPVRDQLQTQLLNLNCNTADGLLVGDIGLGVLAGGGNLNIELGGASAGTTDTAAVSPFGPDSVGSVSTGTTEPATAATPASSFDIPGSTSVPGSSLGGSTAPAASGSGAESLGPLSRFVTCSSVSPAGGGCSGTDVALPVGLISLSVLAGLAGWDYMRQRRRSRLSGQEAP
ncbi:MAG: hypothetical protein ACLPVF_17470 [Acidimicrobiales bacterium]